MAEFQDKGLLARRQWLFDNPKMSEIAIRYSTEFNIVMEIKAHKSILSIGSPYFHRLFGGNSEESKKDYFEIEKKFSALAIFEMLRHIYGFGEDGDEEEEDDYGDKIEVPTVTTDESISRAIALMNITHYFEVSALFKVAEARLETSLYDLYDSDFVQKMRDIYNGPEGAHRSVAIKVCRLDLPHLMEMDEFRLLAAEHSKLIEDLLEEEVKEKPQLTLDLLKQAAGQHSKLAWDLLKGLSKFPNSEDEEERRPRKRRKGTKE